MEYKVVKNKEYNNPYIVINEETGEIIDDAQGYGFKSYQNAVKCIEYKNKNKNYKSYKNKYKKIYKDYDELSKIENEVSDWLFYSFKDGEEIHKNHINNKLLKRIRENIPELYEIFLNDEAFKRYYLNKF